MHYLDDADWCRSGSEATAAGAPSGTRGFTGIDLKLLQKAHQKGVVGRGWRRAQFVTNEFSQYLAIWDAASTDQEPPARSIVRFDKTGTYALLVGDRFVASGKTLSAILPSLAVCRIGDRRSTQLTGTKPGQP